MTQAIRHRRPTEADANAVDHVLVWSRQTPSSEWQWFADSYQNVEEGEWWKPIDQTPPPEKPQEDEEMVLTFNVTEVQRVAVRVTKEDAEYFKELFARHGKGGEE